MDRYRMLVIGGAAAACLMGVAFGADVLRGTVATQDYDIFVDPLIDRQSLFTTGRVTIHNTGGEPLSAVRVNFGGGDTLDLGTLGAGERVIVSPPADNAMEYVQVSAEPGIFVSKAYREPPKMVGMMGS